VVVHAAGAVTSPGVYRLAAGARVADLLDAAGGPAPGADLDRLNLAPRSSTASASSSQARSRRCRRPRAADRAGDRARCGARRAAPPRRPVDLNRATSAELESLPGIGPATAQAILDERARRGRFGSVDELLEVRGIGDAKLAALRDLARV
jgi:competence protein ComEA